MAAIVPAGKRFGPNVTLRPRIHERERHLVGVALVSKRKHRAAICGPAFFDLRDDALAQQSTIGGSQHQRRVVIDWRSDNHHFFVAEQIAAEFDAVPDPLYLASKWIDCRLN